MPVETPARGTLLAACSRPRWGSCECCCLLLDIPVNVIARCGVLLSGGGLRVGRGTTTLESVMRGRLWNGDWPLEICFRYHTAA